MVRILPIPGQPLRHLAHLLPEVDIELFIVAPGSLLAGMELRQLELRQRTGVNVLAVIRDTQVIHNPPGDLAIREGDQLILIGSRRQLHAAYDIMTSPTTADAAAKGPTAARTDRKE
jgi:K+/H+ antiporter YhaU regulatory subunit KhtT